MHTYVRVSGGGGKGLRNVSFSKNFGYEIYGYTLFLNDFCGTFK